MTNREQKQEDVISVDEILYHLYESSGNSTYIRSDHIGNPLTPNQAKTQLHSLLISKLPEKSKKIGSPMSWQIREDGTLDTHDAGYAQAVDDMRKSIDDLFGGSE